MTTVCQQEIGIFKKMLIRGVPLMVALAPSHCRIYTLRGAIKQHIFVCKFRI